MIFPALLAAGDDPLFVQRPSCGVVYLHLVKRLDFHEWRIQKHGVLARRLGLSPNTIGLALQSLVNAGYLDRRPYDGRIFAYRLSFGVPRAGEPSEMRPNR